MCLNNTENSTQLGATASPKGCQFLGGAISWVLVTPAVAYILWVLFGVVAWVQHLGDDATAIGLHKFRRYLPGSGGLDQQPVQVDHLPEFLKHNVPLGMIFVAQHSILSIRVLERRLGIPTRCSRLVYSLCSALALHIFLARYVPLRTRLLFEMPVPRVMRFFGGLLCLVVAMSCMLLQPRTWALLGVSQALRLNTFGTRQFQLPFNNMDAITWMGRCTHAICGNLGFVLFSGLSIIPHRTNIGDVVVRLVAAYYLRKRSASFRNWVRQIEQAHLLTWMLRGVLFLFAMNNWEGLTGQAMERPAGMPRLDAHNSSIITSLCELVVVVVIGFCAAIALRQAEQS